MPLPLDAQRRATTRDDAARDTHRDTTDHGEARLDALFYAELDGLLGREIRNLILLRELLPL